MEISNIKNTSFMIFEAAQNITNEIKNLEKTLQQQRLEYDLLRPVVDTAEINPTISDDDFFRLYNKLTAIGGAIEDIELTISSYKVAIEHLERARNRL
jgi:hypothetical protein